MTTVTPQFASPVDYEAYGVYGPKGMGGADRTFVRPRYPFQGRVSADGSTGFRAEPGRYHLYIALGCPWAHRTAIVRRLKKLTDVVSLSVVDDVRDGRGWAFRAARGPDPVNGFTLLRQAYEATEPGYPGHISVPVLWDRQASRIVSNNFPDITIDLETQFEEWADRGTDLYPVPLRPQIDELNALIYETVNNAVYRIGNTSYQEEYDELTGRLFADLRRARSPPGRPQVPVRRRDHRGRRPAVGDAGPVRRRLLRAVQGQPAPAHRLPEPVGLRPRPVPAARVPADH